MRRIASILTLAALFAASGSFAQNRSLGARRLILDDGAGTNTYVTAGNGLGVSVLTGYLPSACAILDLNANTTTSAKLGFIGPRVAEVDKINICGGTPPAGTLIYNSTFNYYEYFNGAIWAPVVAGWSLHGNGSTIPPAPSTTPAPINPGDFFLGTLDAVDFAIVTNSAQRVRIEGDDAVNGNTVEILNDGATSTGLKIYANGGTGINIDPAATGIIIDATGTGIEFVNSMPNVGIDMSNGATATGVVIDNSPLGIEIGSGAPGGQGIGVNATVNGITVGNITAPNDGLDVNATSTGILVGSLTQPNFGLDVDAAITGATFDAPTIGVDIGQSTVPMLGLGVQAFNTGIDVQMPFGGTAGINVNGPTFSTSVNISNVFGTGISQSQTFGTGHYINQVFDNAIVVDHTLGTIGLDLNGIAGTTGIDVTGYSTSIMTDAVGNFGDGGGADNQTFNVGSGDMTVNLTGGASDLVLNGIDAVVPPGPFDNVLYLNGNIVDQTPNGLNIVTGSGTLNTVPLWTPNGFQLGNSIITQEANASGINVVPTGAGGPNAVEITNFNNTQTAVKINANGGIGVDVDPASTGIIVDATVTGMLIDGSTPTTGININRAGTTGLAIGGAAAPVTGIDVDATTTGVIVREGPVSAGVNFNTNNTSVGNGYALSTAAGNITDGYLLQLTGTGNASNGGFIARANAGSTGDFNGAFAFQTLGDNSVVRGVGLFNQSPNVTGDWVNGLEIWNLGAGDIANAISIDNTGSGLISNGMILNNVVLGISIASTGGTSLTANQNIISTGGFGRFASGVATNSAAPNPLGNQITWSNGNSGTLSTQALTAPRTWLLPDETGVLDAYDPLNNNGFVYFQPEVPQLASNAGSYGNNNLISLQGLATTPNGVVVDMSTNPLAGGGSAYLGSVAVTGVNNGIGIYTSATTSGSGFVRAAVGDAITTAGSTGTAWGANFGATATAANSSSLIGILMYANGANTSGTILGGVSNAGGGATTGPVYGFQANATGVNANMVRGLEVSASGSTANNIGADITTTGVGSIGVDINAGARTGMRITDIDINGASTGIFLDKTTGGTQTAGIDINNASLVAGSTISDGILVRRANNGTITNGMRVVGAVTDYVAADAATTNTGFSSLLSGQVGFNSQATSGTGFQATALTSGTGFNASINGGGDGFNASVAGGATGRGVVSTNTSTATASKAGVYVGNNSNVPGATNIAMQITSGEITVGRENSAPSVEMGVSEGPSGVIDLGVGFPAFGGATNQTTGGFFISNQHARANSIILLTVLDNNSTNSVMSAAASIRAAGGFFVDVVRSIGGGGDGARGNVRIGYMIINPDR